ncbi:MAG: hypothetical protein ACXVDD_26545 [Polyangia bacterium]
MRFGRVLLLGLSLGWSGCAAPVAAPSPSASASRAAGRALRRLLAAEDAAPTAAELRAAGGATLTAELAAVARDESEAPFVRTRAIAALRHADGDEAARCLGELAAGARTAYARGLATRALAARQTVR